MKVKNIAIAVTTGFSLSLGTSFGQGLLAVDAVSDYWEDIPFSVDASVQGGWDSNINGSSINEVDSAYINAAVTAAYGSTGPRTNVRIGTTFGVTHYLDAPSTLDETNYNAGAFLNFSRAMTPRMQFANNLYVSYAIEPDFTSGGSTARRDGQYFTIADRAALTYAWTRRFSTTLSYRFSGILYEDDPLSATEDRYNHQAGLEGRYVLTERTSVLGEYRYAVTDYQNMGPDSTSHFALVGVDHAFSPRLQGMARGGVQFYDSDRTSTIAPYLEASLGYRVSQRTNLRWFNRLGFEGAELGAYDSRYAFRTGLSASHRFTERLTGNMGAYYSYSLFQVGDNVTAEVEETLESIGEAREDAIAAAAAAGTELTDDQLASFDVAEEDLVPSDDLNEHQVSVNLGLAYRLFSNVDLNAGYSFTTVESDNDVRSYDRHRAYMGLGAHF